jgi:hypothetical protein
MAWLETEKSGRFKVCFRYGGRKYKKALKTSDPDDANALVGRLEENLRLLERGRLELPHGANLAVFLLSDGKLSAKPKPARAFTLAELQTLYVGAQAASLERNTLDTVETHLKHLKGTLGRASQSGALPPRTCRPTSTAARKMSAGEESPSALRPSRRKSPPSPPSGPGRSSGSSSPPRSRARAPPTPRPARSPRSRPGRRSSGRCRGAA